ncbi:cell division protein ZapA [Vibrio sp. HA2012]|uniref:cell division protein ZapA n=1 Tax=Vibrio sp. HA2012 TaxID=1971595 RepID=UPI000C2C8DE0|nr:cell division protein ZapA [Vibrio sp. HA2012]PJC86270.1 cell division protein ZapA [Vibrio sp. HA2012]
MSNQAVEIEILGKPMQVNCPPGQEDSLRQAATELDNRLQELAKRTQITNSEKLLTFAALNVCYELQESKLEVEKQKNQLSERMQRLSASLEETLSKLSND